MNTGTLRDIAGRRTLESIFRKRFDGGIEKLLLGDYAALLLFAGGLFRIWISFL